MKGKIQCIVLIALFWVDFLCIKSLLLHRCCSTGKVLYSGLCVFWDFSGVSLGSWFHYSRIERCFSSVWESRPLGRSELWEGCICGSWIGGLMLQYWRKGQWAHLWQQGAPGWHCWGTLTMHSHIDFNSWKKEKALIQQNNVNVFRLPTRPKEQV